MGMHATALLKDPSKSKTGPVVVLPGSERSLKHAVVEALAEIVLGADEDAAPTRFAGPDTDLKTVRDELQTISMWGDRRLVIVEDASDFVSQNRAGLEKYLEKPAKKSVLVLVVQSWPKNTRLAKAVAKIGLVVDCGPLKGGQLIHWIQETARDRHGKQLTRDAAALLSELAGTNIGLLEQELSKLAAYVGDRSRISVGDVQTLVGGWKAETTWAMLGALRDDDLGMALTHLEKLLTAGEAPQKILGGIGFVFRKLAYATELARQGMPLNGALRQAGVFPRDVAASASYLRGIGRARAEQILHWLLEADGNLKGGSQLPIRLQLERLLVQLSGKIP